jgi:hypothetical protein
VSTSCAAPRTKTYQTGTQSVRAPCPRHARQLGPTAGPSSTHCSPCPQIWAVASATQPRRPSRPAAPPPPLRSLRLQRGPNQPAQELRLNPAHMMRLHPRRHQAYPRALAERPPCPQRLQRLGSGTQLRSAPSQRPPAFTTALGDGASLAKQTAGTWTPNRPCRSLLLAPGHGLAPQQHPVSRTMGQSQRQARSAQCTPTCPLRQQQRLQRPLRQQRLNLGRRRPTETQTYHDI